MSDLNDLKLYGRVVRDAEMKVTAKGLKVTVFSIATNMSHKDESGNYVEEGHFFPLAIYGTYAEKMLPHLKQGQKVIVEGYVKQDRWEKDGESISLPGINEKLCLIFTARGRKIDELKRVIHILTDEQNDEHTVFNLPLIFWYKLSSMIQQTGAFRSDIAILWERFTKKKLVKLTKNDIKRIRTRQVK